ncbi:M48 family metallopeptidase [Candidatus Bipolaricaulota bacterium]|nr:M48 family metallopeptidase [Candidatus Bipolaricaulota bacterium]
MPTKGLRLLIPNYTVVENVRSKHVRFRVSLADGLVVVVPVGFDHTRIPELLEGRKSWLARAIHQVEQQRQTMPDPNQHPATIEFPTLDQVWRLEWLRTDAPTLSLVETHPFELQISGPIDGAAAWQSVLRQWLIAQARESLVPWTKDLSQEMDIPIQRVSIRCQKTRWGSYSSKGTVSLNAQLLLVPRHLTQYVLIHELCHAVHLNHSSQFWQLVRQWEPQADAHRSQLRTAWQYVPGWLHHGR